MNALTQKRESFEYLKNARKHAGKLSMLGVVLLTALSIPSARAGCGDPAGFVGPFGFPDRNLAPAARQKESLAAAYYGQQGNQTPSIVGMWKFQVVSTGNVSHNPSIPDGAAIDSGYSQWHADGTEFSVSAPHSPASGNICMGVWENTAPFVYQLNHFALTFNSLSGAWTGTIEIHQTVTVRPGGTMYTGTYIIDAYDVLGAHLDHVSGQVNATRITLDSTVN